MTSKEALERYYSNLKYGFGGFQNDDEELEGLNAIKKDLHKLYEINEVWHKNNRLECVDINADHLQEAYDFINRLIDENLKLKQDLEKLKDELRMIYNTCIVRKVIEDDK